MLLPNLTTFVRRVLARLKQLHSGSLRRRHSRRRMQNFELLEGRGLLSAASLTGAVYATFDIEANNTLDTAQEIGALSSLDQAVIQGLIGDGSGLSADADWYRFTLTEPSEVRLDAADHSSNDTADAVISLYGDQSELFELHNPLRHELLGQATLSSALGSNSTLEVTLDAGTYFVAVTGTGNLFFHPFLTDSGLVGTGSPYALTVDVSGVDLSDSVGAQVLDTNIGNGESLNWSPAAIRVRFNQSLDESLISDGDTVQLFFTPDGESGHSSKDKAADEELLSVGYSSFSHHLHELTLIPTTALQAGDYRVVLSSRLLAPEQDALDYELSFTVAGQEGGVVSDLGDDTIATATDLGELGDSSVLQVAGAIGDDPAYDPCSEDSAFFNQASDVDLYHFAVTGVGQWSFVAEAFAGRFGSSLDPSLTLFQQLEDGSLELVHFNGDTLNPAEASNGTLPLYTDSALSAGLTAGEYFVAVSSSTNDPQFGFEGVFDPTFSHSGTNGVTTGAYVLNLSLASDNDAPEVVSSSIIDGETLAYLPRSFTITFNDTVNLQQTAAEAYLTPAAGERSVFITNEDGSEIQPRLQAFDVPTQTATFVMLDGLPNGVHELHLRAGAQLTDLAGNPLPSNDASGDFVIRFNVDAPVRGVEGDAQHRAAEVGNDSIETAQNLGVLFPRELQSVVMLHRVAEASGDSHDFIRFELLQSQLYFIALRPDDVTAALPPTFELLDANGQPSAFILPGELTGQGSLAAGEYILHVGGWTAEQSAGVAYQLELALTGNPENPTPLTTGATSAIGIRLHAANAIGQSTAPTTFIRPAIEHSRFVLPTQLANSGAASLSATSNVAMAALPSGLNQGFIARPLGAAVETPSVPALAPTETMFVKLWEQPTTSKLFALLDDSLPTVMRQKADGTSAEDVTADEAATTESEPTDEAAPATAEQTETETPPIPAPQTLDRVLRNVNQSLPTRSERPTEATDATGTTSNERIKSSERAEPHARWDEEESADSPLLAGLHAPLGVMLGVAAVTSLHGKKKRFAK